YGAEVTGVCSTTNLELVRSLGADKVIDHTKEDFTRDYQKYDVVFDAVGKSSFSRCKNLLKQRGIYFSTELGFLVQNPFLALWTSKFGSKKVMFPFPKYTKQDVLFFKKLIEEGKLKAVIDRSYPLEQIVEAYRYVEKGHKKGNVVITVRHNNKI
ncbi:MAG: NAD(P)-dependent alcohol dehydrogenase, partial [Methanosarcinales archaeon]|nr:NAD(P)-dependent alcohol dehydrogenase [Methanosarcinales archaeon]